MRLVRNASVYANGVAVKHEICRAMEILDVIHQDLVGRDAEFTSIVDGVHSLKSLHYIGQACDMRIWYLSPTNITVFVFRATSELGLDYDVVLKTDHLHTEFQPKR